MMKRGSGATLRLLSLPLVIGLLAACGQQPSPPAPKSKAQSDIDEVHAVIAATKQHPSLLNAKDAGPPIHVDPYPHSKGAPAHPMHMN